MLPEIGCCVPQEQHLVRPAECKSRDLSGSLEGVLRARALTHQSLNREELSKEILLSCWGESVSKAIGTRCPSLGVGNIVSILCQNIFSLLSVLGMLTYLGKLTLQIMSFCIPESSI